MAEYGDQEAVKNHCLKELEKLLQEQSEEIAGLIIEPLVQGAAGIITHPHGFLKEVGQLCKSTISS